MEKRTSQEPAILEFDTVSIAYNGLTVLSEINFVLPHGAQLAVVGPNGAGKSTLFKAVVGLLPIRSGVIRIHGQPLGNHQDCIAYIPQREEVDWRFPVTVADVVMMGRYGKFGWFGRPSKQDHRLVQRSLEQLGIASLHQAPISDLSGGQQQRVFLARALAQEPHILLMDEPFNGIDATTQEATLRLLDDLKKDQVTVVVSTHDLNLAAQRFDLTLLLNHRIISYGPSKAALAPENIKTAYSGQLLVMDGAILTDDCCGHEHEEHH